MQQNDLPDFLYLIREIYIQLIWGIFRRPVQDIVLGLALYVGQSQITMRYEASMSSLLQESSKALLHLTEVFQKVRSEHRIHCFQTVLPQTKY
jgi:hypothetical protein